MNDTPALVALAYTAVILTGLGAWLASPEATPPPGPPLVESPRDTDPYEVPEPGSPESRCTCGA